MTASMLMQAETFVHPLSVVEPGAQLGERVRIGPFTHIGPDAVIVTPAVDTAFKYLSVPPLAQ